MSLKRIRLELARTPDFPGGSRGHGYEFVAPLDGRGHLDSSAWSQANVVCTVRRFGNGTLDEHGVLIHRKDGRWAFSYAPGDDDEPIFKFDRHLFTVGEYVTVTEHDGVARPFRVVEVSPAIARSWASDAAALLSTIHGLMKTRGLRAVSKRKGPCRPDDTLGLLAASRAGP
jgi:hypothetical protein